MMETDKNPQNQPEFIPGLDTQQTGTPTSPILPNEGPQRLLYIGLSVVLLAVTIGGIYWLFNGTSKPKANTAATTTALQATPKVTAEVPAGEVKLVTTKAYGDKYANGILPVGDGKYVTDTAKQGYVYACGGYAQNLQSSQGGAGQRGPWFVGTTQYDLNKKAKVQGAVTWQAQFTNTVAGATRTIVTNDLPNHTTGVFPISATDPAYAYDRNPNSIKGQAFTYSLNSAPSFGSPSCMGGQVGVMLTGVAMFSGFDAGGRDAGAWEVQDSCSGHPEKEGVYQRQNCNWFCIGRVPDNRPAGRR
jgi:hypothetical protein